MTAPEGDERLFVVERGGSVKVLVNDRVVSTYFNVSGLLPSSLGGEQGMLGLAFRPDFDSNGRVFFSYTDAAGDLRGDRIIVDPGNHSVSLADRTTVIRISQPATNTTEG